MAWTSDHLPLSRFSESPVAWFGNGQSQSLVHDLGHAHGSHDHRHHHHRDHHQHHHRRRRHQAPPSAEQIGEHIARRLAPELQRSLGSSDRPLQLVVNFGTLYVQDGGDAVVYNGPGGTTLPAGLGESSISSSRHGLAVARGETSSAYATQAYAAAYAAAAAAAGATARATSAADRWWLHDPHRQGLIRQGLNASEAYHAVGVRPCRGCGVRKVVSQVLGALCRECEADAAWRAERAVGVETIDYLRFPARKAIGYAGYGA